MNFMVGLKFETLKKQSWKISRPFSIYSPLNHLKKLSFSCLCVHIFWGKAWPVTKPVEFLKKIGKKNHTIHAVRVFLQFRGYIATGNRFMLTLNSSDRPGINIFPFFLLSSKKISFLVYSIIFFPFLLFSPISRWWRWVKNHSTLTIFSFLLFFLFFLAIQSQR